MARLRRIRFDPDPHGLIVAGSGALEAIGAVVPALRFRVLRPDDLVHLEVRCFDCALVDPGGGAVPELVPAGDEPWLEARWTFQHLGEEAWYRVERAVPATEYTSPIEDDEPPQQEPPGASETPSPLGARVRAANGSRLCFDVTDGERIEFTVEGVLAALSRLPLRVSPWATPRPRPPLAGIGVGAVLSELPGELVLALSDAGPAIIGERRARALMGDLSPGRRAATSDATAVLAGANELRLLRNIATRSGLVDLTGGALGRIERGEIRGLGEIELGPDLTDLIDHVGEVVRPLSRHPRPPAHGETAIEAPYRLIVSPSARGGFAHAVRPVAPQGDPTRIELWHSRLGVRVEGSENGHAHVNERDTQQRIVRAIWARDLDPPAPGDPYQPTDEASAQDLLAPFRMSLDRRDRGMFVRQTADPTLAEPKPVDTRRLYLSALGAWLDLHAAWTKDEIRPYASEGEPSVLAWDHIAPMGRDQYVRVVYPGYLFPFGHFAALVKVTERKVPDAVGPQAHLFQRKFLIVAEPLRVYDQRDLPFKQIRLTPLVTPDIDDPLLPATPHTAQPFGINPQDLFWPVVGDAKFTFTLDCLDHAGDPVRLQAPLLFVAAHLGTPAHKVVTKHMYTQDSTIDARSQKVAISRPTVPGDTTLEVESFTFLGIPGNPGDLSSRPNLVTTRAVVPATRHLAPNAEPLTLEYAEAYLNNGFDAGNEGQVFARVVGEAAKILYESTDRAGGLIAPNLPIEGLSRKLGPVGDVAAIAQGGFNADQFLDTLGDQLPKLFGIVSLTDLLDSATQELDRAPRFLTEMLDVPLALIADLPRLVAALESAAERLGAEAAAALVAKVQQARDTVKARVDQVLTAAKQLQQLTEEASLDAVTAALETPLTDIGAELAGLEAELRAAPLPPTLRAELERLVASVKPLLETAAEVEKTIDLLTAMVNGIAAGDPAVRARYEWRPKLSSWPAGAPIIEVPEDGFALTVEARASARGDAGFDALAEIRDLAVNLVPGFDVLRMEFDRIAFRSTDGRKPEVDVLFGGIEFRGILKFVETLSEIVPFDALSDPPYVEVDASGARAGIDVALPSLAVGVFSLENISLGLDGRVPFLGEAVTVGFNFCTRERPFVLTVMMFGGGGFVGLRASPNGLVLLEGSLEFGARASLDFGVASGSIEVMGGVYYRQEDDTTTLTGYVRLRGEVELLGIASVSLTAELSLTYRSKAGGNDEMYGQAKVTLEIEVAFIEYSASFTIERRFAGSRGDPILLEAMDVENGKSAAWTEYCTAFAEE